MFLFFKKLCVSMQGAWGPHLEKRGCAKSLGAQSKDRACCQGTPGPQGRPHWEAGDCGRRGEGALEALRQDCATGEGPLELGLEV